ncbi:MAG: dual specificity protein phosphatase family protein [Anaerolineae bacterium]|nr:dual specificity protein phosphatase family protein [Anaerolineae bacterium]
MTDILDVLPLELRSAAASNAAEPPLLNAYWVVPGRFMVGPYPGGYGGLEASARAIEVLLDAGVAVFIDLTEAGELALYAQHLAGRARHARMPITDFEVPSAAEMTQILDAIDRAMVAGEVVYLHCFAGLGRTGTVVGCYLVRHGLDGEAALVAISVLRQQTLFPDSRSPQTDAQRNMVRTWSDVSRP